MVRVDGKANGSSLVKVRELDKKYQRGSEEIHVLQGLNLDVGAASSSRSWGPPVGQDDAVEPARRPRPAHVREHQGRRRRDRRAVEPHAHRVAGAPRRLHLPDLQPDPGADRLPERRAAAAAHQALAAERRQHVETALRVVGPGGPRGALPAPALRRPGAARGDRARHRHRPDLLVCRRADRRPGPQERRRDHRTCSSASIASTARRS